MNRGLRYGSEVLLGLALGFFYYVFMIQVPKSAFLNPIFLDYQLVAYFGIPLVFLSFLFVYSHFKLYAFVSFAAIIGSYVWFGTELVR
ncbi:hypothetical protein [Ectobacillus ponti]|uniref:Uncharacterized protein n=1 Tax=Ectobacillus ponti TaxID=2961894 RepID=A0AA41XBB6_9BACI|nr:hypothetical protein [Ectobacillus ponti]MCP8968896.1 hypothetical protein [Ectobacillus ponti]